MQVEVTYWKVDRNREEWDESSWTETVDIGKPELYHNRDPKALVRIVQEELEQVHTEKDVLSDYDVGEIISISAV